MPLVYAIDKAARLVTVQYDSNPEFVEFEKTMDAVFKDSNYEPGFSILLDRSLVGEPPSTNYIKSAVGFLKEHEAQLNCLAIVTGNMATYGMERMAQILADGINVDLQVFTDMERAKQWLRSELNSDKSKLR